MANQEFVRRIDITFIEKAELPHVHILTYLYMLRLGGLRAPKRRVGQLDLRGFAGPLFVHLARYRPGSIRRGCP